MFYGNTVSAQIGEMIYDPYNMWLVGDHGVVINDIADEQRTLKLFDFSSGSLIQAMRSGRGPGEVSPVYYKRSTSFSNGDIFLWDAGRKRMTRYSSDLEYKTDIRGNQSITGSIYQAGLINDSTLFTVDFTEEVFKAWRIRKGGIKGKTPLWSINRTEQTEFDPLANFTLLQTLFYSNFDGVLYIAFEFSSQVMAVDEEGIVFINSEPDNIPLPPNDEQSEQSGRYSLPEMGKYPEGARDITVDSSYMYLLMHGGSISKWQQLRYATNFDALIEKVNHTKRLLIYDRYSGAFLEEKKLPILSRQAKVRGDSIYLLKTLGRNPEIRKVKLAEL
ncbi:hypothetical protein [Gracilimonas mengyeensis]|nr:hypothetical protein [Gracilimonas mengyeensis]